MFVELSEDEQTAKDALMEVEKKYPSAVKEDTADSIIAIALQKKKRPRRTVKIRKATFCLRIFLLPRNFQI